METPEMQQLAEKARKRAQPYRVLIVDDEPWVREVFKDFCELTDACEIEMAKDGQEALEMIRTKDYDLITLDLIMPEMSGLDVLTAIKKVSPRVPIMVITGNATDKLITRAGVLGACRVIHKPVQLDVFISELASALPA